MASTNAPKRKFERSPSADALAINSLTRWRKFKQYALKEHACDHCVDHGRLSRPRRGIIAVHDLTQRQHAVTQNFPVLGHFRYFFAGDLDERPYNRVTRSWVYGTDFSAASDEALRQGNDLANDLGASLIVCHVVPEPTRSLLRQSDLMALSSWLSLA